MRHPRRYDLPKGHLEDGETELECALRELREETGIAASAIDTDSGFRYEHTYYPRYKRFGGERVKKTLVMFVGYLTVEPELVLTEHAACDWIPWSPPLQIQAKAIDPLLKAVADHFSRATS